MAGISRNRRKTESLFGVPSKNTPIYGPLWTQIWLWVKTNGIRFGCSLGANRGFDPWPFDDRVGFLFEVPPCRARECRPINIWDRRSARGRGKLGHVTGHTVDGRNWFAPQIKTMLKPLLVGIDRGIIRNQGFLGGGFRPQHHFQALPCHRLGNSRLSPQRLARRANEAHLKRVCPSVACWARTTNFRPWIASFVV